LRANVAEGKILVDGLDGIAESGEDGGGRELSLDCVGDELLSFGLTVDGVEGGGWISLEPIIFGVGGDADDLVDGFRIALVQFRDEGFADRIDVRVDAVGETLVDDCDERGGCGVGWAEASAIEDRDAVGLEEVPADCVDVAIPIVACRFGLTGGLEGGVGDIVGEQRVLDERDGLDAGNFGEASSMR
jgi:hypothetical protein